MGTWEGLNVEAQGVSESPEKLKKAAVGLTLSRVWDLRPAGTDWEGPVQQARQWDHGVEMVTY